MKYQNAKNSYFILFMSEEQCIYYKFGYSSDNFLSIKNSLYTNSRLVCLDIIQEIQCDLVMKWMFVKERRRYLSNGRMVPLDRVIKNDIINVISKYIEIDLEGLDIKITQTESDEGNGTVPALFANIPIRDLKTGKK